MGSGREPGAATPAARQNRPAIVAALPGAIGSIATLLWRQTGALAARARPYARRPSGVEHGVLLLSPTSGDGDADASQVAAEAEKLGITNVMLDTDGDVEQAARDAIEAGADAIGVAGGDAQLGCAAGVAVEHGVPLFCVPTGARNRFALDLGLDLEQPLSALDAIGDGEQILVDLGVANGRPFLNGVGVGLVVRAVHSARERDGHVANLDDLVRQAASSGGAQPRLRYETPDGIHREQAALMLVSNNRHRFASSAGSGRRMRLDTGRLGVAALPDVAAEVTGSTPLNDAGAFQEWDGFTYRIESDEHIPAIVDGASFIFGSPLELKLRRKALSMLVPVGVRPGFMPSRASGDFRVLDLAETAGIR